MGSLDAHEQGEKCLEVLGYEWVVKKHDTNYGIMEGRKRVKIVEGSMARNGNDIVRAISRNI